MCQSVILGAAPTRVMRGGHTRLASFAHNEFTWMATNKVEGSTNDRTLERISGMSKAFGWSIAIGAIAVRVESED